MQKPFLRTPYNYDTNKASDETGISCPDEGLVKQSFKDECDINVILKRFGIGYQLPQDPRIPQSGDFTGITDFHSAMNQVRQAQEAFMELPANIRSRFNNDPGEYVDFCTNEANKDELRKLGLLKDAPIEEPKATTEPTGSSDTKVKN